MRKIFRKVVAVSVASMMAIASFPVSSLAASSYSEGPYSQTSVDDYTPNITMQFGVAGNLCDEGYNQYEGSGINALMNALSNMGPKAAPVTYDWTNHTFKLERSKSIAYETSSVDGCTTGVTSDVTLGTGDYVAVTVSYEGIDKIQQSEFDIKVSGGAEPAGIATNGMNQAKKAGFAYELYGASEEPSLSTVVLDPGTPVDELSASSLVDGVNDDEDSSLYGDHALLNMTNIMSVQLGVDADPVAVSDTVTDDADYPFVNSDTGALESTWSHGMIAETFLLKITDASKPITFEVADPYDEYFGGGGKFGGAEIIFDAENDGSSSWCYCNYAKGYDTGCKFGTDPTAELPGSRRIKFMGTNLNDSAPTTSQYTITYQKYDGTQTTADYDEGTAAADVQSGAPANTEATNDETNKYTYAWPTFADVTAAATYVETQSVTPHVYGTPVFTWTGTSAATVTATATDGYVCEKNATITSAPGTNGSTDYTASVVIAGKTYTDVKNVPASSFEITYQLKDGTQSKKTLANGATAADVAAQAPANTAAKNDADYHYTYAWPTFAAVTGPATYVEVESKAAHVYGDPVFSWNADNTCKVTLTATDGYVKEDSATVTSQVVDPTCTTAGKTVYTATYAGKSDQKDVPGSAATGHTYGAPTWSWTGYTAASASFKCTKNDDTKNETATITSKTTPATALADGETVYTATVTFEGKTYTDTKTEVLDASGVTVTVAASALGTVEMTGAINKDAGYGANQVKYGASYKVTATPSDDVTFLGWSINGKVVTQSASYSSYATGAITLTPLFASSDASNVTVTYMDRYGNVVKTYTGSSVADVQAQITANAPTAPAYNGYTFDKWDTEVTDIKGSTTIVGQYKASTADDNKFTVNAGDATVTLPAGIENGSIPYDTKVTVTKAGATAWKINGTVVGYGSEYSFYIGADTTITAVTEAVEETATVAIEGAALISGSTYRAQFYATKNIPDTYTLVNAGFVYGKNLTAADLDLLKVDQTGTGTNSGVVKVGYASSTASDQIALAYGIKSASGQACVRAFATVKQGSVVKTIYSNAYAYDYATSSLVALS